MELRLSTAPVLGELLGARPSKFLMRRVWEKVFFDPAPFVTDEFVEKKLELACQLGAHQAFLKCLRSILGIRSFLSGPVHDIQEKMLIMDLPVLVIWGRDDQYISVTHHERLVEKIRGVRVELFDRCGHAPHAERADLFHETVAAFLKDV